MTSWGPPASFTSFLTASSSRASTRAPRRNPRAARRATRRARPCRRTAPPPRRRRAIGRARPRCCSRGCATPCTPLLQRRAPPWPFIAAKMRSAPPAAMTSRSTLSPQLSLAIAAHPSCWTPTTSGCAAIARHTRVTPPASASASRVGRSAHARLASAEHPSSATPAWGSCASSASHTRWMPPARSTRVDSPAAMLPSAEHHAARRLGAQVELIAAAEGEAPDERSRGGRPRRRPPCSRARQQGSCSFADEGRRSCTLRRGRAASGSAPPRRAASASALAFRAAATDECTAAAAAAARLALFVEVEPE